ncbi:MAG: NUDIX domain-containing protein [Akkermansia sp.]|nr:NUDIX domain-containing protein [Akkermansia sp.]
MDTSSDLYRPNAAIIYRRSDGTVLVCERVKPAGAWQFPQGGIKKGESPMHAACREGMEETGFRPNEYEVVQEHGPYRYDYPPKERERVFRTLGLADAAEYEAQCKRKHRGGNARPACKFARLIEGFIQRIRRREPKQRIRIAVLHQRMQIPAGQIIPQIRRAFRANHQHRAGKQRRPIRAGEHTGKHTHRKAIEIDDQQHAELGQKHAPLDILKQAAKRHHQQIQQEIDANRHETQHHITDTAAQEIALALIGQRRMEHALSAAELMPHEHHRRQESETSIEDDHQFQIERPGHDFNRYSLCKSLRNHLRRCQVHRRERFLFIRNMGKPPERHHIERDQKDDDADKQIAAQQETGSTLLIAAHIHDPPFPE